MKFISVLLSLCLTMSALAENTTIDPDNLYPQVKLETSMGVIIVELDKVKAPLTVDNFLTYVVNGEYNNTIFHRIIQNFIVQGGGYDADFTMKKVNEDIVNESGNGLKNEFGTIAMAKERHPHSANRQFFFNVNDNSNLDPGRNWGYAVFGSVIEGEEVLEAMAKVKTDYSDVMGWEDVPLEPVLLVKATLLPAP
ncbi:peptidyl-prolyl cis-trans isomerase [Thalassotalea insulae]|uniref:Peptidyl-prolyl cis-trans isomerase n=1 Tax=Thalassotalea insulae TaxID=2056778 RepID=A0ABQ6GYA6_9GAMM|nr:peptidylprolyl isomerase [Thalassotalea insulae]GLX79606.1 peptidyl-prolyl cis-trans isomerase [Thalassotalea insulae]